MSKFQSVILSYKSNMSYTYLSKYLTFNISRRFVILGPFRKIIKAVSFYNKISNTFIFPVYHLKKQLLSSQYNKRISPLDIFTTYKKDAFFPLSTPIAAPINNTFIQMSGLATLPESFKTKLLAEPLFFKKFAIFILTEQVKILYYMVHNKTTESNLLEMIAKSFALVRTAASLQQDKELQDLYDDKYISICQHLLNLLFHNKKFDIRILNYFWENRLDFTLHDKKIPLSVIIESYIAGLNIKNLITKKGFFGYIMAIDHENPLLEELTNIYKRSESIMQIAQMNSDFLLYYLEYHPDKGFEIIKFYRDVKANYTGPAKGHFTLIPYLTTDKTIAGRYMNNYTSLITSKLKEIKDNRALQKTFSNLKELQLKLKKPNNTVKDLILNFNTYLLEDTFNKALAEIGFHVTVASDVEADDEFTKMILPLIKDNIEKNYHIFETDIFFPKSNKISQKDYEAKIQEIVLKIMPKELQNQLLNNINDLFITNN